MEYVPEFFFCVFETFSHEINGLIFLILVGLDSCGGWLEGAVFGLVGDGVEEFAVA